MNYNGGYFAFLCELSSKLFYLINTSDTCLHVGETEGHDWALPRLKLRDAVRTAPAFPFMFPRPDLWPKDKQTLVVTFQRNYTVDDYESLFKRIGCEWCYDLWKDNGMALGSLKAPSVPVHCIYSSQVPTAEVTIPSKTCFFIILRCLDAPVLALFVEKFM